MGSAAAQHSPGSPADWVNAGHALQRILLTAGTCGVAVALHSQPTELSLLRDFIRAKLSDGAYPHLVLRIGMVTQAAVSVRRHPDEVLFSSGGDHVGLASTWRILRSAW
jgi:hypothetical protein